MLAGAQWEMLWTCMVSRMPDPWKEKNREPNIWNSNSCRAYPAVGIPSEPDCCQSEVLLHVYLNTDPDWGVVVKVGIVVGIDSRVVRHILDEKGDTHKVRKTPAPLGELS